MGVLYPFLGHEAGFWGVKVSRNEMMLRSTKKVSLELNQELDKLCATLILAILMIGRLSVTRGYSTWWLSRAWPGLTEGDYYTKHHPAQQHIIKRPIHLNSKRMNESGC